ncbi:MAG: DNA topoisomerase [Candidatus Bathyarchaeia archaeon]
MVFDTFVGGSGEKCLIVLNILAIDGVYCEDERYKLSYVTSLAASSFERFGVDLRMLIVTEKGSVARALRSTCIRAIQKAKIVPLRGHILELDFPEEYNIWRRVNPKELFRAPVTWVVRDRQTYMELKAAAGNADVIVIATDNDAEGELIGYEVLLVVKETLKKDPPYYRMRFNAATPAELVKAWSNLEHSLRWSWVWKALLRHRFDLVTGAAFTRLLTLSGSIGDGSVISWGSCQSPTLWFVYKREMEIRNFNPEKYWVLSAWLNIQGVKVKVSTGPIRDLAEARKAYSLAVTAKEAMVLSFKLKDTRVNKPLPTDTDVMLQELAKLFGLSGARSMAIAEELYAEGFISYPRTETDMWVGVDHHQVLNMLRSTPLSTLINVADFSPKSGVHNDEAHPPIHPTGYYGGKDIKGKIWEFLARRYLANVVGRDALLKVWNLNVSLNGVQMGSSGRYLVDEGFYNIFPYFKPKDTLYIPQLQSGQRLQVLTVKLEERETKPPPRLTEAELLELLKKHGIGTDATRADYPHIIIDRGYAWKKRRTFHLSELGERLIKLLESADNRLVTPETRHYIEELMIKVEKGELQLEQALHESLSVYEKLYEAVANRLKSYKQTT